MFSNDRQLDNNCVIWDLKSYNFVRMSNNYAIDFTELQIFIYT